jgi:hypothetical protein
MNFVKYNVYSCKKSEAHKHYNVFDIKDTNKPVIDHIQFSVIDHIQFLLREEYHRQYLPMSWFKQQN